MITFTKLTTLGRLGNQLFQVAATIGQSLKCESDYRIPPWKYAQFFKGPFKEDTITSPRKTYQEPSFHYNPIPCMGEIDLHGYFQSEKYWDQDVIRTLFQPSELLYNRIDHLIGCTGIHIRRGDYLLLPDYHTNLTKEYYSHAMSLFKGPYHVFSDDIPWCRENIEADYYHQEDEIIDFFTFSSCSNIIMANSSFSWWAAYLSRADIICPKEWFGPKIKHNTKDLFLPRWQLL